VAEIYKASWTFWELRARTAADLKTSGRWCIVLISKFIQGCSLKEFQSWMDKENRRAGYNYDVTISS
jgi:hypothetical protein